MVPVLSHGRRDVFKLAEPAPEVTYSRGDEDVVSESWHATVENAFAEGMVHPEYPGVIVDQVRQRIVVPGVSYVNAITGIGDVRGLRPTKIVGRGEMTTLDVGWDEFQMEYLSWLSRWKPCTAAAATDVVTCASHGFANGQKVVFRETTGGAGLTPASATNRGTAYFVRDAMAGTFKVAATLGGSAVDITSNLTAGKVCAAEFVKGHPHPDHPNMFIMDVRRSDRHTDWQRVTVTYRGMMEVKPFSRTITCNGQGMSSGQPITWLFPGGWVDARNAAVNLPKIVCTDTYLTTDALATDEIPLAEAEGATPPDPPDIRTLVITGDSSLLTFHWPNGWSRLAEEHVGSIPLAGVNLKRRVTEYVWPVTVR